MGTSAWREKGSLGSFLPKRPLFLRPPGIQAPSFQIWQGLRRSKEPPHAVPPPSGPGVSRTRYGRRGAFMGRCARCRVTPSTDLAISLFSSDSTHTRSPLHTPAVHLRASPASTQVLSSLFSHSNARRRRPARTLIAFRSHTPRGRRHLISHTPRPTHATQHLVAPSLVLGGPPFRELSVSVGHERRASRGHHHFLDLLDQVVGPP